MADPDTDAILDQIFRSADRQIAQTKTVLTNNLEAADRIHARQASEALVRAAEQIATNPTT